MRGVPGFIPAFISASGLTADEVMAGCWPPAADVLEVLGEMEHLRWNAFHFVMGYSVMSADRMEENARIVAESRRAGVPCSVRITKDSDNRLHACLISWEELDALSQREKELTGREISYKQIDINNVLVLPQILQAAEKAEA